MSIYSQEKPISLIFGLRIENKINHNTFDYYWEKTPSLGVNFKVEENIGTFGFGFNVGKFDKKIPYTKSFFGIDYFLLYKKNFELITNYFLTSEINLGLFEFRFVDLDLNYQNDAGEVEREFFIKYLLGLSYLFYKNWQLEILASFQKIYTNKRIDFFSINVGINYRFDSPSWLKEFFN